MIKSATARPSGAGYTVAVASTVAPSIKFTVPVGTVRAVQEAVRARGWEVIIGGELLSDAMGAAGTPEGTYIGMVKHNVDTIVGALK